MKLRLISRVIVLVLVVLVGALIVVRSRAEARHPASTPAPALRLAGAVADAVTAPERVSTHARAVVVTLPT